MATNNIYRFSHVNLATLLFAIGSIFISTNLRAPIEIELKFRVTPSQKASVIKFLRSGGIYLKKEDVSDLYYDTAEGRLTTNKWRLRVRNNSTITLKHTPADATARYEFEESLPLTPSTKPKQFDVFTRINELNKLIPLPLSYKTDIAAYLAVNTLECTCPVVKTRTTYAVDKFNVMYDEIEHLGTFVEIELLAPDTINDEEIVGIKSEMRELISELGLTEEKQKYEQLMMALPKERRK